MSRRAQIAMTSEEVDAFLAQERVVVCATNGRDGFPHLMPLWYVVRDGEVWAWTFARSQKVRNLERDPRATLQVEAGETYDELRGVMLKTEAEIVREPAAVQATGLAVLRRYAGIREGDEPPDARAGVERQAAKRVALRFAEHERATWDHRKLASGVY